MISKFSSNTDDSKIKNKIQFYKIVTYHKTKNRKTLISMKPISQKLLLLYTACSINKYEYVHYTNILEILHL